MAVEAVVSVVIRKLTNLLIEESEVFEKVIDDVERVRTELRETQSILNGAEHQEQSDKVLTDRVAEFLRKVYRVEDDIESFALEKTHLKNIGFVKKHILVIANKFKLCREVPGEMDYSENVRGLKSEMNKISEDIQTWKHGKPLLAPALLHNESGSHAMHRNEQPWQENDAYYAPKKEETNLKKDMEELVKQLTSNSKRLQIISVLGDVGSGKATHVRTIYNKFKKKFSCRALVVVPTKCSVRHLLMAILQQVTSLKGKEKLEDKDLTESLHEFLMGQNYLIVITDIKSIDLLEKLRLALPDTDKGSRVVITTPDEKAASFADASSRYHFEPLDKEDGLKLFIKEVRGLKGSPLPRDVMEDLKNKIAERCKGTPLRIIMLAGLLSTRKLSYEDWWSVFEKHDFATKSPSFDIIAFCYNDLPLHLKPCDL